MGFCAKDVVVEVSMGGVTTAYQYVEPEMVARIVDEHIVGSIPVKEWESGSDCNAFHAKQNKVVLGACGTIDPEDINSYREIGGYQAVWRTLGIMSPVALIEEIKRSALRGRAGPDSPRG